MQSNRHVRVWAALGLAVALGLSARSATAEAGEGSLRWVDPFLGAEAGGNTVPGACVPFGMAKVSADCETPWTNGWSEKNLVLGISQTHVSGTGGSGKYGNFRVTPWQGDVGERKLVSERAEESATPGYYTIRLTKQDVKAEVTATRMVGLHRYTFGGEGKEGTLLLDAGSVVTMYNRANTQQMVENSIRILAPNRMEGMIRARGGWGNGGHQIYFSAEFDRPFASFGIRSVNEKRGGNGEVAVHENATEGSSTVENKAVENQVGFARFDLSQGRAVMVKVAVSFVSSERARQHMEQELPGWDFEATRAAAAKQWAAVTGKIAVEGGSDTDRTKLYTAMYHMHQMPVNLSGDNAWWTSDEPHYEDFYCMWDTFRGVHPMLLLLEPDRQREMLRSLIDTYEHTGWMPDARVGGKNGYTQGGSNGDVLVADAMVKGLKGVDYTKAYAALVKNAEVDSASPLHEGRDVKDMNRLGYIPIDYTPAGLAAAGKNWKKDQSYGRSASRTMEYCYDDFCIAEVAKALGRDADYQKYLERSEGWKKLWDEQTQAIRPRFADGRWMENYDRKKGYGGWGDPFFQGNGWTYSTYVPHDGQGLIDELGGDEKTVAWLDAFFDAGCYDQGNEPGFLAAFLYIHAGRPDKTQDRVRTILETKFKTGVRGLPGNDDAGAESAWIVSASIGLYPNAGQPYYYLCSPVFEKSVISVWDGRTFTIEAPGASKEKRFIVGATLNGQALDRAWVTHEEVVSGGVLHLTMGEKPGDWGRKQRPYSVTAK